MVAGQELNSPDFIPDSQFKPDAPIQNASPDFIPDSQFKADDEKYSSPLEMGKTALEQGLSGATLGVSKVLETKLGITTPEAIQGRAEANPILSTGANIAGTVATGALTGGLGTGLGAAIGEGAIISGVNEAADQLVKDKPELSASKIVDSAGMGALFGLGGGLLAKGLKEIPSKISEYLDSKLATTIADTPPEGYADKLKEAYTAAGTSPEDAIKNLTSDLKDMHSLSKQTINDTYNKAGKTYLKSALEDVPVEQAQMASKPTIEKIDNILTKFEDEMPTSTLSPSIAKRMEAHMNELHTDIVNADSAMDVHKAMTDFATKVDKNIKFTGKISENAAWDQEVLNNVRQAVRGDLKDPAIWGQKPAEIYSDLNESYVNYANAKKEFEKNFAKKVVNGRTGQPEATIDPGKVNAFFKDTDAPNQELRKQALNNFMESTNKNLEFGKNYEDYQNLLGDLKDRAVENVKNLKADQRTKDMLRSMAEKPHVGLGDLALLETLPKAISAPFVAIHALGNNLSAVKMGSHLYKVHKAADIMANYLSEHNKLVDAGMRGIFKAGPMALSAEGKVP